MPSRPVSTIALHTARAKQLRTLARMRLVTVHELIEQIINGEIEQNRLADTLPGLPITVQPRGVGLEVDGIAIPPFPPKHVIAQIAPALLHFAEHERAGKARKVTLPNGFELTIGRLGRGVFLDVHDAGAKSTRKATITPTMARDLARQLLDAAKQAG